MMNRLSSDVDSLPVAALYVATDSLYKGLGVDCYDINRDARNYTIGYPVVAHPPCRAWSRMRAFAKPPPGERELALLAIKQVRMFGGVLEHPIGSALWPDHLPMPGQIDKFGGFTISVDQFWWGHLARKRTLLYIVGCKLSEVPAHPLRFEPFLYTVSTSRRSKITGKKEIPKRLRSATPIAFARYLIKIALMCRPHVVPDPIYYNRLLNPA